MGWERKRGKLIEFNRLLRGATDTSFTVVPRRPVDRCRRSRYVITLDSDTQLPMEAARRLVGTLAHPLNRPRFDPARRPRHRGLRRAAAARSASTLVSANRTAFAKVFSGHVGVDPYTTAVSDVYQDLFHEGSYVGKGIYDVDAFEAALAGPRARERAAQPRPVRRLVRARRPVHRHPSRRRLSRRTTWRSPRGSIAGSAATGRSCAGCGARCPTRRGRAGAEHAAGHRALEDPRQPAPQPAAAGAGGAARSPAGRSCRDRRCCGPCSALLVLAFPGLRRRSARSLVEPRPRRAAARARRGRARQPRDQRAPGAALGVVPRASELADGRRHRAHALAPARHAAGTCSSGCRPIGSARRRPHRRRRSSAQMWAAPAIAVVASRSLVAVVAPGACRWRCR